MDVSQRMLAVAIRVAPSDEARQGFSAIRHAMLEEGRDQQSIVRALCQSVVDGISAGNWPAVGVNQAGEHKLYTRTFTTPIRHRDGRGLGS